jgi:hypothetical protein
MYKSGTWKRQSSSVSACNLTLILSKYYPAGNYQFLRSNCSLVDTTFYYYSFIVEVRWSSLLSVRSQEV